ncbi:MAG: hypothetical protein DA330_01435 [Nitrososphaera sp.]|jgi:hypothetical protein|nr:hypothetical protein [Nitrososphaera sp.]
MERVSGETISGSALALLAILFIYAGMVNPIWAIAMIAYYILLAIGLGTIALGLYTTSNTNRKHPHTEEHKHH